MARRGPTLPLFSCLIACWAGMACKSPSKVAPSEAEGLPGAELEAPSSPPEKVEPEARAPAPDSPGTCPDFGEAQVQGVVQAAELNEVSGLASSRRHDALWTHNDSGDGPRLYALDFTGRLIATLHLRAAEAVDWEDVALVPGPGAADSLYVADFGDNRRRRSSVVIYLLDEPTHLHPELIAEPRARLELRYPDGAHDAESLLVHPKSHEIFIITKHPLGISRVHRKSPPHVTGSFVLEDLGSVHFGVGPLESIPLTTAGDFSADGRLVAIRTYDDVFLWSVAPGADMMTVLHAAPCARIPMHQPQGESLAFARDGSGLWTLSEQRAQPLLFIPVQP